MGSDKKKNFLFFFVHPSKYYLFRYTINYLKQKGHNVEIAIIKKDVLEDLVKQEGWDYVNIFPEGRRSNKSGRIFKLISTFRNFLKTVFRLYKYTAGKQFDLFITDDCLSVIGWIRRTPVIMFTDDDLRVVPEIALLYWFSDKIIAPESTDLGRFAKKKVAFKGYKELAYLHPKYFVPDKKIVQAFNTDYKEFVIVRLVSLTATHDANKKGLSDIDVLKIIDILSNNYEVFISSERPLDENLEGHRLKIPPESISQVIYYASMLISDSQTMTSEAAVLGIPSIRFNDFVGKISVMEEKEIKYDLTYGFKTNEFDKMLLKIQEMIQIPDLKQEWQNRRQKMLDDSEDVNIFLIKMFENYPENVCGNN